MITEEQANNLIVRNAIMTSTGCGKLISDEYEPNSKTPQREILESKLRSILSFCDLLELYKIDKKAAYKLDRYTTEGFEKIYGEGERETIIELTKKYRTTFDMIYANKKVNLEELAEAGKFFDEIYKEAKKKLPRVKLEDKSIAATK